MLNTIWMTWSILPPAPLYFKYTQMYPYVYVQLSFTIWNTAVKILNSVKWMGLCIEHWFLIDTLWFIYATFKPRNKHIDILKYMVLSIFLCMWHEYCTSISLEIFFWRSRRLLALIMNHLVKTRYVAMRMLPQVHICTRASHFSHFWKFRCSPGVSLIDLMMLNYCEFFRCSNYFYYPPTEVTV